MNIDAYIAQARAALGRLDALVGTVNDVVENRVEKALKVRVFSFLCVGLHVDRPTYITPSQSITTQRPTKTHTAPFQLLPNEPKFKPRR